jgi:hypothetical protein
MSILEFVLRLTMMRIIRIIKIEMSELLRKSMKGMNLQRFCRNLIDCIDEGQEHEAMQQPRRSERVRKRRN